MVSLKQVIETVRAEPLEARTATFTLRLSRRTTLSANGSWEPVASLTHVIKNLALSRPKHVIKNRSC